MRSAGFCGVLRRQCGVWTCVLCGRVWRGGRSAREPRGSRGAFTFRRPVLHPGPPWHVALHSRVEGIPPTEARAHKPGGLHRTETHPAARAGSCFASAGTREVCGRQQGASHLEPAMAMAMAMEASALAPQRSRLYASRRVAQQVRAAVGASGRTDTATGLSCAPALASQRNTRPYTCAPRWGSFGLLGPPGEPRKIGASGLTWARRARAKLSPVWPAPALDKHVAWSRRPSKNHRIQTENSIQIQIREWSSGAGVYVSGVGG